MICPKCNQAMEDGYLQCGSRLIWDTRIRKVSLLLSKSGDETDWGVPLIIKRVSSYRCQDCGFVIVPIPPLASGNTHDDCDKQ